MNKEIFIIGLLLFSFNSLFSQNISIKAWQFHVMQPDYVKSIIDQAEDYDINTVSFSHEMIWETSVLYNNADISERGEDLRTLAKYANARNLDTWIWIHELDNVPSHFIEKDKIQMDKSGFWKWLEGRYNKLFIDFPEFDGIILTFHETEYKIFDDKEVNSSLTKPERFMRMITSINNSCVKYNKELVVRTFLYEPEQLEWVKKGLQLADASNVIIQSKCVPHDWQPYYPNNPLIGAFPENRQIIEFDCSSEFTGKNKIPFACAQYFTRRFKYGLRFSEVSGYIARIDHGGHDGFNTPNNINIYTLYRLSADSSATSVELWRDWAEKRYGKKAAPYVIKTLYPTEEIVKKTLFHLKFWITNKSHLPSFAYGNGHISSRSMAKWRPNESIYKKTEEKLNNPDVQIYEKLLAEKEEAITMIQKALVDLRSGKKYFKVNDYDELRWQMDNMLRIALIWKLHTEAFFGYKLIAEGHLIDGLKERIERAIEGMLLQADIAEYDASIGHNYPGNASNIRTVANELKKKLSEM